MVGKKFLRQHPIYHDLNGKETFYIADFYCHELKLIIEIDGEIHKFQRKRDNERDYILNMLGLNVIRIRNEMIKKDLDTTICLIENYIIKKTNSP